MVQGGIIAIFYTTYLSIPNIFNENIVSRVEIKPYLAQKS